MSNLDLNVLSAVWIKQICILFEDLVHISMILLVLTGPLHKGIRAGRLVHISMSFKRSRQSFFRQVWLQADSDSQNNCFVFSAAPPIIWTHDLTITDMPLQNLENQEISGKKNPGNLTKNQEIVSNKFCSLSHFKLCIFSLIFNT